jgi:hypothetical protein
MGNTANNNWPYPESTDLVKDGATAIENLADAIDTTLGVYAPSTSGLTLINTTSFTGVSSQSINDVFSATYENYVVVMCFENTADTTNFFRWRVSGTDDSSANYSWDGTTSFTGFSLLPTTGTITGFIKVYGLAN